MSDLPDDQPATDDVAEPTERLSLPTLDSFAAVRDLIALCIDPRSVKQRLRQLHDSLAAVAVAQQKLDAREAAVAAREAAAAEHEKAITAQELKLREGQVALATAKDARLDAVIERERRVGELEAQWRFVAEDDDVRSGFRSAEFSALMKARAAYGFTRDSGLDEVAKEMAEKFPRGPTARTGFDGTTEFPKGVTLTRDLPPSEPPAAGVRIRGGRKNSAPLPGPGAA
jgi:hypothetical protein